jgi:cytosine/adenosine deaminase-related metal-dependent hydrolase
LHDEGSLGTWELELICDFTERYGLAGRVAVSHAYGLGEASPAEQDRLAKRLAEAGVSITTAAVYSFPVAPVRRLRVAGVTVACGHDGIRDLWGLLRNRRHEWISARARVIQPPGDYIWLDAINAPKVTNPWFLRLCGPAS